jgi:hypothetical protein
LGLRPKYDKAQNEQQALIEDLKAHVEALKALLGDKAQR